jgi:hypothetical protein
LRIASALLALALASLFIIVFADVDTRLASPGLLAIGVITCLLGIHRLANPEWRSQSPWVNHRLLRYALGGLPGPIPGVPSRYVERVGAVLQVVFGSVFIAAAVLALIFPA